MRRSTRPPAPDEIARGTEFAAGLSLRVLGRAWQILLKGFDEIRSAPKALSAAEMVLVRLAYAADLPTPDEALKALREGGGTGAGSASAGHRFGAPRRSGGLIGQWCDRIFGYALDVIGCPRDTRRTDTVGQRADGVAGGGPEGAGRAARGIQPGAC